MVGVETLVVDIDSLQELIEIVLQVGVASEVFFAAVSYTHLTLPTNREV